METRKEKWQRSTEAGAWKSSKAIILQGQAVRCHLPSVAAIPRGLSLCARTHVQGLGAHYCFQIAVLGDSQQVLPYTQVFLDNCDANGLQHKHNACQGVTQPLGQRACPPLTIPQPLTWLLPLPVISQSPFTNGHPSLGTPHPLVFLKVRSAFPGFWVFFLH